MASVLGASAVLAMAGCTTRPAPVPPPAPATAVDLESLLRDIGAAFRDTSTLDDKRADELTLAYIERGDDALLAAASYLLTVRRPPDDEDRDRGARMVLQSLSERRHFAFLERLSLPRDRGMAASCNVVVLVHLLGNAASWVDDHASSEARADQIPFISDLAELLIRIVRQPWATCVQRGMGGRGERGHSHPHLVALQELDDMLDWSVDLDGSLASIWDDVGAGEVARFEAWWEEHAGSFR